MKSIDTILEVPYFSQYLDVADRQQSHRACGMVDLYMVLQYYKVNIAPLDELIENGVRNGGYTKSGWVHDYLVKTFQDHGISCERKEQMEDGDVKAISDSIKAGNPVIISMQRISFDRRLFHMVVITGIRENEKGELEGFFYHDPAGLVPEEVSNLFVPVPVFLQYWRRMAIFPSFTKS